MFSSSNNLNESSTSPSQTISTYQIDEVRRFSNQFQRGVFHRANDGMSVDVDDLIVRSSTRNTRRWKDKQRRLTRVCRRLVRSWSLRKRRDSHRERIDWNRSISNCQSCLRWSRCQSRAKETRRTKRSWENSFISVTVVINQSLEQNRREWLTTPSGVSPWFNCHLEIDDVNRISTDIITRTNERHSPVSVSLANIRDSRDRRRNSWNNDADDGYCYYCYCCCWYCGYCRSRWDKYQ